MNNVSASALFNNTVDAKAFAVLLRFEKDAFQDLLLSSTPSAINRMRVVLTQGREQLANGDSTMSVTRTMSRVKGLLSVFDTLDN